VTAAADHSALHAWRSCYRTWYRLEPALSSRNPRPLLPPLLLLSLPPPLLLPLLLLLLLSQRLTASPQPVPQEFFTRKYGVLPDTP
jgi:hypothetical protein